MRHASKLLGPVLAIAAAVCGCHKQSTSSSAPTPSSTAASTTASPGALAVTSEWTTLTNDIATQTGLAPEKVSAAVGGVLMVAQAQLSPADYGTLVSGIPAASSYLKSAQSAGMTGPIPDRDALRAAVGKLGISADQGQQVMVQFSAHVKRVSGSNVADLLAGLK